MNAATASKFFGPATKKKIIRHYDQAKEAAELFNAGYSVEYLKEQVDKLESRIKSLDQGFDYWHATTKPSAGIGKTGYLASRKKQFEERVGIAKLRDQVRGLRRVITYISTRWTT